MIQVNLKRFKLIERDSGWLKKLENIKVNKKKFKLI